MFIGRNAEFQELEKRYSSDNFQFAVIYGRRRIGKSFLIKQFIKKRKSIYFVATEQNESELLKSFTNTIKEQLQTENELIGNFENWEQALNYIANLATKEKLVFVIDEYPYLSKSYPPISSILQKIIDEKLLKTNVFLILCGSSMSFMEKQVLGYESPLYGRRTAQFKLKQMPYYESIKFFPNWKNEEKLLAYGACGGVPQYLSFFSKYRNVKEAIVNEFLTTGASLNEEPDILLKQELREPALYNSILTAIACGKNKSNEIANATGKNANLLVSYLKNLISLEIIEKRLPVEETNIKKSRYVITDNLYRFWYTFIQDVASLIQIRSPEEIYDKRILPYMPDYFGRIFEDICMQYLTLKMKTGDIAEFYEQIGRWWGSNPKEKQQEEIDVVMTNKNEILVAECKWLNDKVGKDVFFTLEKRANLIQNNRAIKYYLFSKSGFEKNLIQYAKSAGNIETVDINQLLA